MDAKVSWKGGMEFDGLAGSTMKVPLSSRSADSNSADGFKPMELFAIGLAGCTAMDVISILEKKRQEISKFEVDVHTERASEHPRVFTSAIITYKLSGKNIDPLAVERAIDLSSTKYCPAQAMLSKVVEIKTKYEITEEG